MAPDLFSNFEFQRSKRRYLNILLYLENIKQSGKIHRLTKSQVRAIQTRLSRCLSTIRKYLKLAAVFFSLGAISTNDLDAQCRMNRLPISNQSTFLTIGSRAAPTFVDLDSDGDMDLVVGNFQGILHTYENNNGFFKPASILGDPFSSFNVDYDNRTISPVFADIDKDGDLDAFVGEFNSKVIYLRNSNGNFFELTGSGNPLSGFSSGEAGVQPSFVDIDKDGDQDAFIGYASGEIKFLRNINGSFFERTGSSNPFNGVDIGSYAALSFADVDKDGDQDAFIGAGNGKIHYFKNTNNSFSEITGSGNPFNGVDVGGDAIPTFVDIDNDGDSDAYIGGDDGMINFFRNDNGSFVQVTDDTFGDLDIAFEGLNVGPDFAPTFGDMDDDGDKDAFVGQSDGTIRSFRNTNGTFTQLMGSANPMNGFNVGSDAKPVLIDMDADNDLDLIVGNRDGKINYFRNDDGVFVHLTSIFPLNGVDVGTNASPGFADFDGDRDKDAFIGAGDGTIHYFRNDSGIFVEVTGTGNPFNGIDVGGNATPTFAQFSPDRMFVGNKDGTISEFRKSGNSYVPVTDSPFIGVDVGFDSAPAIVDITTEYPGVEVVIGNRSTGLFVFSDQGGRSNVWQGPFTSDWHGPSSNWDLMTIPELECDDVYLLQESVLIVDLSQTAEGRTITVKQGGEFEVKSGAELIIDPE